MKYKSINYLEPSGDKIVGTVAELFAGVGGFRIGLARSGWKTIYSNQWEPSTKTQPASDCYVFNFGEDGHANMDISTVEKIPKTDLLVAGFPCQDYSVAKSANTSKGLQGKKGVLWWDIHRLVSANRPKYVFLENVDRLLKSPATQRGRDFAIMLKTLGELGYLIEWRVVNAADYGFPQRRIRVLIVATRTRRTKRLQVIDAQRIIFKDGVLARALTVRKLQDSLVQVDLSSPPDILSKNFGNKKGTSPFENSGVYLAGIAYTTRTKAVESRTKKLLGDVLVPKSEVKKEYWLDTNSIDDWIYLKGAKSIERIHKGSGVTYNYAEGNMSFPDSLTNPSRTILTGEGGKSPSRFKHVIKVQGKYRRLMPVELERLNGFPDGWTSQTATGTIPDSKRAFFMGNALVIGLVEKVGRILAEDIESSRKS